MSTKAKKASPKGKAPRARRSDINFESYIYKVLKQVHPDTGITTVAKKALDRIIVSLGNRISNQVLKILIDNNKKGATSREIQTAVRLIFPGELAKHAVREGVKAVTKFNASMAGSAIGEGLGKKHGKKHGTSRSARAGLTFPVKRCEHLIRQQLGNSRVGVGAPLYLAAVLEYITAELLELAGNKSRDDKKVRITDRHLMFAVRHDEELNKLFQDYVLGGGVVPNIHSVFVHVQKKKKTPDNKAQGF
jgi:histone H2A